MLGAVGDTNKPSKKLKKNGILLNDEEIQTSNWDESNLEPAVL